MLSAPHHTSASMLLLPYAAASVADARHRLADDLRRRRMPSALIEDAVLVLSEIMSNALRHARPLADNGKVGLTWLATRAGVRLEVSDGGAATRPHLGRPGRSATGCRGLAIVNSVASAWGVREGTDMVTVWACLGEAATDAPDRPRLQDRPSPPAG